jgi:hypothetical protein
MDDLRRRFARLDGVQVPDLWDRIEQRAADFGALPSVSPVRATSVRSRRSPGRPLIVLLAAAAVLVALVAGALAMGSGPVKRPLVVAPEASASHVAVGPSPSDPSNAPASPSPATPPRLVAYTVSEPINDCQRPLLSLCHVDRAWVVNTDGTDARPLQPESVRGVLGWTRDGSRVMYSDNGDLAMLDTIGSAPVIVPNRPWCPSGVKRGDCEVPLIESGTGSSPVLVQDRTLCPTDVKDHNCQADIEEGLAVSPDGSRIAYALSEGRELDLSSIVIYDLSSGRTTRLGSTRAHGDFQCRTSASEGVNGRPTWSPDGTKLAFERQVIGPLRNGACQATVFVVGTDGNDLVQLVPKRMIAIWPSWSPDSTMIAFQSASPGAAGGKGPETDDIYTVRSDGSALRQLTDDGRSIMPRWTSDGRIVYRHLRSLSDPSEKAQLWVMDADGGHKTRIADGDIAELTELGCTICPYGPAAGEAYWQPQQ